MVVVLVLAQAQAADRLVRRQRQALRSTSGATMRELRTVRQLQGDGIEAVGAGQGQRRALGRRRRREGRHVREPGAVGPAVEVRLAQRLGDGPVEGGVDGVVVGQDGAVGLQEVGRVVAEVGGRQRQQLGAAVEELVDRLAGVGGRGVLAEELGRGRRARVLELDPDVREAVLGGEEGDVVGDARVARVGVAEDEDRVADGVSVDGGGDLLDVGGARGFVGVFGAVGEVLACILLFLFHGLWGQLIHEGVYRCKWTGSNKIAKVHIPSVSVQVVDINPNTLINLDAHEGEALRSQTIGSRGVRAIIPFNALEINPVKVGQGVEA